MSRRVDHETALLVDTNTIIESHRTGSWQALAGGYRVETVELCVTETQTGFQRRRPEQSIVASELRVSLSAVHPVGDGERVKLLVQIQGIALDEGEEALWAHALGRDDGWFLCGPDKASLRCGVSLGFRERLVSLEELLAEVGHRPRIPLKPHYTKKWLEGKLAEFVLNEWAGQR
ncbi:MAG: hypothetical protein OXF11_22280 [Deltaproteobacteria bacterium]|nr:hypothetical protein [Deltaproteobacteria bacterium]